MYSRSLTPLPRTTTMSKFRILSLAFLTVTLSVSAAVVKLEDDSSLSFNVSSGDAATLACPAYKPSESYSTSSLQWRRELDRPFPHDTEVLLVLINGTELSVVHGRYSLQHGTNLVIGNPTASDGGRYYCQWIYRLRDRYDLKRFRVTLYYHDGNGAGNPVRVLEGDTTRREDQGSAVNCPVILWNKICIVASLVFIAFVFFCVLKYKSPEKVVMNINVGSETGAGDFNEMKL